jgi:hypothetical protein
MIVKLPCHFFSEGTGDLNDFYELNARDLIKLLQQNKIAKFYGDVTLVDLQCKELGDLTAADSLTQMVCSY